MLSMKLRIQECPRRSESLQNISAPPQNFQEGGSKEPHLHSYCIGLVLPWTDGRMEFTPQELLRPCSGWVGDFDHNSDRDAAASQ